MGGDYFWIRFEDVSIKARISARAKYLQLLVSTEGILELVQPLSCKAEQAQQFLRAQTDWIKRQAHKLATLRQASIYTWPKIESGVFLPFLGQANRLSLEINSTIRAPVIHHCSTTNQIRLQVRNPHTHYDKILIKWLKNAALEQVTQGVADYGLILKRLPTRIQVKQYRRRWGSLSSNNDLSVHWRLIFAPASVLKYVVLHEMCHLFYRNHGQRFYQLLAKHMPEYRDEEAWLRNQGFLLNFPILPTQIHVKNQHSNGDWLSKTYGIEG